jgi:L-alanine-DL-glutamate epimerase-like enolase superfamily enzyme
MQDTPEATYAKAKAIRAMGFRAAKFGWGPWGRGTLEDDIAQAAAAREGLGADGILLIDAGTIWENDPAPALQRAEALRPYRLTWLEEPFRSEALDAYRALAQAHPELALAAGEGANNLYMAQELVRRGGVKYLQIDAGRVGGITTAYECRKLAEAANIAYVNHTFTSALALSASLQPFAGVERFEIAEYPTELQPLAADLAKEKILPDAEGYIRAPEAPGLGIAPNLEALQPYLVSVRIEVGGKTLYETPPLA